MCSTPTSSTKRYVGARALTDQERERKASRFEMSGLTEEELQRQQEQLFAASKARFEAAN